tara:strand:- start:219 stop:464 length:246 start_codon:yes stop_codon:yes gene_type:complete
MGIPAPFPLWCFAFSRFALSCHDSNVSPSFITLASGVAHPEQPLSDLRRADARSRQIARCDGVTKLLQIKAYSLEPFKSKS